MARKPRNQLIGLAFDGPQTISGIQTNPDGSLTFLGAGGEVLAVPEGAAGTSYPRPKGPKITFQLPDSGRAMGSLAVALDRYDRILGVDTNTRDRGPDRVSVTVVSELADIAFSPPGWSARVEPLWAFEFWNPTKDPERIGWRHALAHASDLDIYRAGAELLLVVDCHLGELHALNRRDAPMIDEELLLPYVSLAYASSDTANDSPLNAVIAGCDRVAREILRRIDTARAEELDPLLQASGSPFQLYRGWLLAEEARPTRGGPE